MTHYDLVVLGTGSGNTIVDDRWAGRKVVFVEPHLFGGTCLNVGCIPTKMFVHPADIVRDAQDGPRLGARTTADGADWAPIRDRIFGRIDPIPPSGKSYREEHFEVLTGTGRFTGPGALSVDLADGSVVDLTADQVVIAVGARAWIPDDVPGLTQVRFQTSDTVMRLPDLPRRLGVIGGGYVAAEFAHVFAAYGTDVVQIVRDTAMLTHLDGEVSQRFTEIAGRQWDLRLSTTVSRVEQDGEQIVLHLSDGTVETVDELLVATGRRPATAGLGLESAGIATHDDGRIRVDAHQRTTVEGVWALGDCSSEYQLKHVANHEARVVQHNLLHPDSPVEADHRFVPHAVFTAPQIAGVGLTEEQAGDDVVAVTHAYGDVAFGWALEDTEHFVKLLGDRSTGRLVGAHLIGPQAATLIQPLIQAMSFDQPVAGLARGQYWIHPALPEVVENALLTLEDRLRETDDMS
ncbi:mycothione reductase [Alteromonas gracilis]